MTLSDIEETAQIFAAAGRRNIPVPISEWKEMQMARIAAATVKTNPKTGRQVVKPVEKGVSISRKIGRKAKADRLEKAWKSPRTGKEAEYEAGVIGFRKGDKCPYDKRTRQGIAWTNGWRDAAAAYDIRANRNAKA